MTRKKAPLGEERITGETCPESGLWEVVALKMHGEWLVLPHDQRTTGPFAVNNRFPPYKRACAKWALKIYG